MAQTEARDPETQVLGRLEALEDGFAHWRAETEDSLCDSLLESLREQMDRRIRGLREEFIHSISETGAGRTQAERLENLLDDRLETWVHLVEDRVARRWEERLARWKLEVADNKDLVKSLTQSVEKRLVRQQDAILKEALDAQQKCGPIWDAIDASSLDTRHYVETQVSGVKKQFTVQLAVAAGTALVLGILIGVLV